ncbi:MAG: gliding motility lipoprotein GldB [Flavisolibacter sp.]
MNKDIYQIMRLLSISLLALFVLSCKNYKSKPDISGIKINVQLQRFDQDFFSIDTNNIENSIKQLYKKYPSFLPLYFEFFSPINFIVRQQGKTYSTAFLEYYHNIKPLYDSVQAKYKDVSSFKTQLENQLRYVKYYFPYFKNPAIFTTVESLNPENAQEIYGALYFRDTLALSLQMFLGKDFSAYDPTQYFDYLRRRFEPPYMVPNSIRAIAESIYPDTSQTASLLEQMIEKGKLWYMMENFMPDVPDSLITGFSGKQLRWCKENEGNIWGYITKNTDIYTVDTEIIQNYIGEAPFTQGMPEQQSPGNIGQWVGWQIVKKYALKNPSVSLQKVLETPATKLFQTSQYKPK